MSSQIDVGLMPPGIVAENAPLASAGWENIGVLMVGEADCRSIIKPTSATLSPGESPLQDTVLAVKMIVISPFT
jgi:hypothetical protein